MLMKQARLNVLVLSEYFPNPVKPAFGIFVERQTTHVQAYCNNVVVAPVRVFPHLRLWKQINPLSRKRVGAGWQKWRDELALIPRQDSINGVPIYYPRYTSLPKQLFHATWGFFAYPFLMRQLRDLHKTYSFDLIHAHYAAPAGIIALLAQRWLNIPIVLSVHGTDVTYTAKQHAVGAAIIRSVFQKVDLIFTNSSWTAKKIVRYGGSAENIRIVRLGGTPDKNQLLPPSTNKTDELVILSVGYIEERKGHRYVLHALQELKKQGYRFRYVIVGNGSKEQEFKQLTKELGLEKQVSFEGYKPHAEVWPYFAECDIFALPSWNEAFGVVYIEALSQGKAIIGCEGQGGPEDLKSLGDCIELVQPKEVESLVQAFKRLIDDPSRRQQVGETGKRLVEQHFTWERNAAHTFELYQQVLETHRAKETRLSFL